MYRLFQIVILVTVIAVYSGIAQHITWVPTDKSLSGNINELAVQGNTVFAGTVAGVHKTTDLGKSWTLSNNGLENTKVFALAVKNDNELYCGTHGGVYYSSDKGATWIRKSNGLTDNYITTITIKDDTSLYAGTLYSGMFYSNDGANNWVQVTGDFKFKAVNSIAIRSSGHVYVGSTSGLYRSDANGQNYLEMVNDDLPEEPNVYTIHIRSNGIVYIGTRNGQVYRTINNGNSWTYQYEIPGKIQIYTGLLTETGALLYGTYGEGVFRSNDNAESFQQINDGLSNLKVMALAQTDNGEFFAGTWGSGVFKGSEPPLTTIASGTYCAGSELLVSYKIRSSFSFEQGNVFYVELSDFLGSFAKPDTIGQLTSVDDGSILCLLPKNLQSSSSYKVRVVGSNPGAVGASNQELLVINELPKTNFHGDLKICINSSEQYGIATQKDVRSIWSVIGGTIKSPATTDTIDVDWNFAEDASIKLIRYNLVTGCSDTVIKSVLFFPPPSKPTISRMGDRLVSSANSGNQWYQFGNIMPGETDKILELKEPGLYTVQFTDQNGCVSPLSDEFDYNVNSVDDMNLMSEINVYPTPSTGIINLSLKLSTPENVNITIHTLNGEQLGIRELGFIEGDYSRQLDMINFTNGTYYLKFNVGEAVVVKKVIISR